MPVTGGTGEVSNFTGTVDYGGTLVFVNGANGKNVAITGLELNFFTGALTGVLPGATKHTALAYVGGDLSTSTSVRVCLISLQKRSAFLCRNFAHTKEWD